MNAAMRRYTEGEVSGTHIQQLIIIRVSPGPEGAHKLVAYVS